MRGARFAHGVLMLNRVEQPRGHGVPTLRPPQLLHYLQQSRLHFIQ
jgi:hypothetical protein